MVYKRSDRVADLIRQVLAEMLLREMNDPRLEPVTITGVELTADLKLATIFFSAMGSPEKEKASLKGFQSAAGFIKKKLGKELRLRVIPDLLFRVDHSFEYGSRIDRLIETAQEKAERDPSEDR